MVTLTLVFDIYVPFFPSLKKINFNLQGLDVSNFSYFSVPKTTEGT